MEKGLTFFKHTDLDFALKKLKWNEIPFEKRKCIVCKISLTKENIGAFVPSSTNAVCRDFTCIMAALLKEKKSMLRLGK
jgi:hypothetical protein